MAHEGKCRGKIDRRGLVVKLPGVLNKDEDRPLFQGVIFLAQGADKAHKTLAHKTLSCRPGHRFSDFRTKRFILLGFRG